MRNPIPRFSDCFIKILCLPFFTLGTLNSHHYYSTIPSFFMSIPLLLPGSSKDTDDSFKGLSDADQCEMGGVRDLTKEFYAKVYSNR